MTTANQEIHDAIIRHQTYLIRFAGGLRNEIRDLLRTTEDALIGKISRLYPSGIVTGVEIERLKTLLSVVSDIRREAWGEANTRMRDTFVELVQYEPVFLATMYQQLTPVLLDVTLPSKNLLTSIVRERPFEGRILSQWAAKLEADDLHRINSAIQTGLVQGQPVDTVVKSLFGDDSIKGIVDLTRAQIESVVRTATMFYSNQTRNEFIRGNTAVFNEELFVATLDARTTPICRKNDGKVFHYGQGPQPPLHYRCRSTRVASLDGDRLGDRPANPTTEKQLLREFTSQQSIPAVTNRDLLPYGYKTKYDTFRRQRIRELVGPIPAHTTYQEWLMRQSSTFQDEVLGKTKAQLFRSGKVTLDQFVALDGTELTLKELYARYPAIKP